MVVQFTISGIGILHRAGHHLGHPHPYILVAKEDERPARLSVATKCAMRHDLLFPEDAPSSVLEAQLGGDFKGDD